MAKKNLLNAATYKIEGEKSIRRVHCILAIFCSFLPSMGQAEVGGERFNKNVDAFQIAKTIKLPRKGGSLHIIS